MTYPTTIYLSDEQRNWINEMSLNVSKYVRSLIDRDMERWKQITEDVLIPIVETEKKLDSMCNCTKEQPDPNCKWTELENHVKSKDAV